MKTTKRIILIVSLLALAIPTTATAKTPSVLLQEALYAERAEGDLEKAITLYQLVLEQAQDIQRIAARATYQLGLCYQKKGDNTQAAKFFNKVVANYPTQKNYVKKANRQLEKLGQSTTQVPDWIKNNPLPPEVLGYISQQYGQLWAEASPQNLYANCHIYGVDFDYTLYKGGMGVYRNNTSSPVSSEIRLSGTDQTDQTLFDFTGQPMNIQIRRDKPKSPGQYGIYWTPSQPIQPGQMHYYSWITNKPVTLPADYANPDQHTLTMKNHFGSPVLEAFFLVIPQGMQIKQKSQDAASHKQFNQLHVYCFKDKVPANTTHKVNLTLAPQTTAQFPEFHNLLIKEKINLTLTKPTDEWWQPQPTTPTREIYENSYLDINWQLKDELPTDLNFFAIAVVPQGVNISEKDLFSWCAADIPITVRNSPYGKDWPSGYDNLNKAPEKLKPGNYQLYVLAVKLKGNDTTFSWRSLIQNRLAAVAIHPITIKPMPMTQININEIQPDGTIKFQSIQYSTNNTNADFTQGRFINSDFVKLEQMFDQDMNPVKFTAKHEGNIYRYKYTLNKPVKPGQPIIGANTGTTQGKIKPVPNTPDTYQYTMRHFPAAGQPVRRVEIYRLPKNAQITSELSPDLNHRIHQGRHELYIEKIIPTNGSILTEFQYALPNAQLASDLAAQLIPAPWLNDEIMQLTLKNPAGSEYGSIIYSAKTAKENNQNLWLISSYLHVTQGNLQQYTLVKADLDTFAPTFGQTKNWMGDFTAAYTPNNVSLTTAVNGQSSTKDFPLNSVKYDNEQALYLIRRLPLKLNYQTSFPIFTVQGGATVDCRIKVLDTESITVPAGTFKSYKTDLTIYAEGAKSLQHTLWFSADEHHYLVKYDVGGTATMELSNVAQSLPDQPNTYKDPNRGISFTAPDDWQFYQQSSSTQILAPQLKTWAILAWTSRNPPDMTARTIAETDAKSLKDHFEKYTLDPDSWTDLTIDSLQAAQYHAQYLDRGTGLQKFPQPRNMIEYRTYIVHDARVYWFVFRTEKTIFQANRPEFDNIINSFKLDRKALKNQKLQTEQLTTQAWALWKQQKFSEAEPLFQQAVDQNPQNENAYQGLGWAQFNQGKNLNAQQSFEKCIALNPKNSAALNGLGWIAHAQKNTDQAITWWQKAVQALPSATAALNGLTQTYMERKDYNNAAKYFRMWLKAEPNNEQAQKGLKNAVNQSQETPDIIGKWQSVDFVSTPDQFQPDQKQWKDDLFLKEMTFNPDGTCPKLCTWTQGWIHDDESDIKAQYYIKQFNGQKYLFFPWLSGDVTERGQKPHYYVLKKIDQTNNDSGPWAPGINLLDDETRQEIERFEEGFAGYFKNETRYELANDREKKRIVNEWKREALGSDFNRRVRAIAALNNTKAQDAVNILIKIAEEPMRNNRPKWMAVRALANIGDPRAIPTLIGLVNHGNTNVRVYARLALAQITGVYFKDDKTKWKQWYRQNKNNEQFQASKIKSLIQEMHTPSTTDHFAALNELVEIGQPAVTPLINELQISNNWQIAKALGAIGDPQAITPLIEKWQTTDTAPMNDIIAEALTNITEKDFGKDKQKWQAWWLQAKESDDIK